MSATGPAARPRPCVRCYAVKSAKGFPPRGRRGGGVTRVCWTCVEAEAWAMYEAGYRPRLRVDVLSPRGCRMRLCVQCRTMKPATRRYFEPLTAGTNLARVCRRCRVQISRRSRERQRQREGDRVRAHAAAMARLRRARSPEVRRKEAEVRKRWREKKRSTAQGRAELLETERMSRRLKREREGRGAGKPVPNVVTIDFVSERLPSAPLVALVDRVIVRRRAEVEHTGYGAATERIVGDVLDDLGLGERRFHAMRSGERKTVPVDLAERVLLRADVDWREVWPEHGHVFLDDERAA